jgi:hypothetical protein
MIKIFKNWLYNKKKINYCKEINIMEKEKINYNAVFADILGTKEVLLNQLLTELVQTNAMKSLTTKEKKELKFKCQQIFDSQFDSLITRLQKKLG